MWGKDKICLGPASLVCFRAGGMIVFFFFFFLISSGGGSVILPCVGKEASIVLDNGLESEALKDIYVQMTERSSGPYSMFRGLADPILLPAPLASRSYHLHLALCLLLAAVAVLLRHATKSAQISSVTCFPHS